MLLLARLAVAAETSILLEGEVPDDGLDHFLLPFEVPPGTVEIELRHHDGSDANVLDWGVNDPAGWRGWGGGTTAPAILNAEAATPGYVPGPIAPGTWRVVGGKAKIVEAPARYAVEVVLRDTATLPAQARRPWSDPGALATGARWYAGDVHVHSVESTDANATLDAIADLARARGLDWVVITDHNTVTHLDFLADAQERHPDVLLVPGTEFTTYAGHAGAYGATAWVDHKIGQPGVTIEGAVAAYAAQGAVFAINHPVLDLLDVCIGCAWEHAIPEGVGAIEIATGGWAPAGALFTPGAIALWDELCDQGLRLAAVGGSDDHRAGQDEGPFGSPIGSATTMVWAEELSIAGILDGIRAGRTVVKLQEPADPMAELALDGLAAEVVVSGAAGDQVVWVVDGQEVARADVTADPETFTRTLDPEDGRVRVELWRDGAPRTVTSHLWTAPAGTAAPPEPRRCGCASGAGAGWIGIVALLAARGRRIPRTPGGGGSGQELSASRLHPARDAG